MLKPGRARRHWFSTFPRRCPVLDAAMRISRKAEYALRGFNKPIGVAGWETEMVERLPEALRGSLPTVEEIEAELAQNGSN